VARRDLAISDNAPGAYFVDSTCIDCDMCRQVAPAVFARSPRSDQSFVKKQPDGPSELRRAAMALVACPTSSIGTSDKRGVAEASRAFPDPVTDDVFFCGYASEASFGASSWLIRRPRGNVLVDSPRAAKPLLERIAALGGVTTMVLSHRDDVADHARFHASFGARRVMHEADRTADTAGVEQWIRGESAVRLDDELTVIPVPGHTRGSIALLYQERVLFTGDHLWASEDTGELEASKRVCWFSWREQIRSLEKLLEHRFEWILPGHGRSFRASSAEVMRAELARLVERLKAS
jgi:glyoxylase-like metal-dependent hydrolase (beta-lactamase superfamily II)/ferredoxin